MHLTLNALKTSDYGFDCTRQNAWQLVSQSPWGRPPCFVCQQKLPYFWLTCFIFQSHSIHINFAESLDLRLSRSADWSWESFYLTLLDKLVFPQQQQPVVAWIMQALQKLVQSKKGKLPILNEAEKSKWTGCCRILSLKLEIQQAPGSHRIFTTWSIFFDKLKFVKYGRHVRLVISELSFKVRMVSWSPWWRDLTWRSSGNFLMLPRTSRRTYCCFESFKNGSMIEKLWWSPLSVYMLQVQLQNRGSSFSISWLFCVHLDMFPWFLGVYTSQVVQLQISAIITRMPIDSCWLVLQLSPSCQSWTEFKAWCRPPDGEGCRVVPQKAAVSKGF